MWNSSIHSSWEDRKQLVFLRRSQWSVQLKTFLQTFNRTIKWVFFFSRLTVKFFTNFYYNAFNIILRSLFFRKSLLFSPFLYKTKNIYSKYNFRRKKNKNKKSKQNFLLTKTQISNRTQKSYCLTIHNTIIKAKLNK